MFSVLVRFDTLLRKRAVWPALWTCVLATIASAQPPGLNITTFPITNGGGTPQRITSGPDGALWFTQGSPQPFQGGAVSSITTSGLIKTQYHAQISYSQPSSPVDLAVGPDGAVWFSDYLAVGRVTTGGVATSYPTPLAGHFIAAGSDGAIWFTGTNPASTQSGAIGRITPTGGVITIPLPAPSFPQGITLGPDGALWFLDPSKSSVGLITTSGNVTEYSVPHLGTAPSFQDTYGGEILVGQDGALWFADGNLSIGRITTAGALTEYPVGVMPDGLTKGPDGAVWFTSANSEQIGQITPTGLVNLFNLPSGTRGVGIALGPDGALWVCGTNNTIMRIQVPVANGALSHIAAGAGWTTIITLINTATVPITLAMALHGDDGSPLTLPVTTIAQGVSKTAVTAFVNATISPGATLLVSMGDQLSTLSVGWAKVVSSGPLGGFAVFRTRSPNSPVSEGTVPLQNQLTSTITIPFDNTSSFVTGMALANLSTSIATVTVTIKDDSGTQLGTQTLTIAGSGHTSFVVPNQLPQTVGVRGIVTFQNGSGGISGLGLRFSPFGTFTSLPAIF